MVGITLLNIQLTDEYLESISKHFSASVVPSRCDAFKFRTSKDGSYYLHPLLDDIFFAEHCMERYCQRKTGKVKSTSAMLERAYPDRYIFSGKKDLDELVHCFVVAVLNGSLEFAKGSNKNKEKGSEAAIIIRIEKQHKVAVLKYGPFFLFKTFMNVGELDETEWVQSALVIDPYKALQRIFKDSELQ